jgi:hypothetical protein
MPWGTFELGFWGQHFYYEGQVTEAVLIRCFISMYRKSFGQINIPEVVAEITRQNKEFGSQKG